MAKLIYEGQLKKKGKINTSWKNRWFTMSQIDGEIYLQYYSSKMSQNLCGTIQCSQIYEIKVLHRDDYNLTFLGQIPDKFR